MIQLALLVGAILWVAINNPPRYLWNYLLAQGIVNICLFSTLQFYSVDSWQYERVYELCSVALAICFLSLAWYFLSKHLSRWAGIASGAFLGASVSFVAYHGLVKPLHSWDWVGVLAGGVLAFCGTCLAVSAPYHYGRDRLIALVIGFLFIAQSLWQVGFVLHLPSDTWERANFVVPTLLCVSAWTWLGIKLRQ